MLRRSSVLISLPAVLVLAVSQAKAADAPTPAFYYNTLGQPWQSIAPGLLDWENTLGFNGIHTSPGSGNSSSEMLLTSLVTGLTSWADVAVVAGGSVTDGEFGQAGGFFGGTSHLGWDLGSDNGLALYTAPSWSFDKDGIGSTAITLTASAGHEPSDGWSRDANLAVNFVDHGSFAAVTSPDLDNLWTWSALATMGHALDIHSSYSFEGFGSYSSGEVSDDAGGPTTTGTAWRVGAGLGYQRNFGHNPAGQNAWALYGGLQWERADGGGTGKTSSPSAVVNFSLGTIRPRAR